MNPAAVPQSLQDVAEAIGLPVVLKLIAHFGGTEIKFPKHPDDAHPVIVALGKDDGIALCNFLSGGLIYVPHMKKRGSIRAEVLALEYAGKDRAEIARLLGVSQRWVRAMANRKPDPDQMSLFTD